MKPKELIIESIGDTLHEVMASHGFKYLKSLSYKRRIGEFTQKIQIQCNRYNRENETVEFWISDVSISSKKYKQWLFDKFGDQAINDHVYGKASWNIPAWNKAFFRFDIADSSEREQVLVQLKENVINAVIPFLDQCSTWKGIAASAIETSHYVPHSSVVNFLVLSNQQEEAYEMINRIETYLNNHPERVDRESELEKLSKKRNVFFNDK